MYKNQHVTPRPDGKWQVKGEHNKKATAVKTTQAEAIEKGKTIAQHQHSELVIHGKDGKITENDSFKKQPALKK